jgi:hypothetical protein
MARAARPTECGRSLAIIRPSISEEGKHAVTEVPKLFRVTLEVGDLETATGLYRQLFAVEGTRHPGARHYFAATASSLQ